MRPVPGTGPTLYAKLLFSKKKNAISTAFFDSVTGHEVDPADFVGKYLYAKCAVKIESIFIGQRISLQVKIYEAEVEEMQMGRKRLLPHKTISNRILTAPASATSTQLMEAAEEEEPNGNDSLDEESEEDEPPPRPKKVVKKKKTVRRVVKKK